MTERGNAVISLGLRGLIRRIESETDGELLERFVTHQDGEAFARLVRRHGPMVFAVCRRVLGSHADAEDAFQATFLVLARRAGVVRPGSSLANWLHGVALRTAREARRAGDVRRVKERTAAGMRSEQSEPVEPTFDLSAVLDRELAALPEVYRAAVVVCDLEGLSRAQAATHLGWSEGTLSGRLARARAILARRLGKYGLTVSGGLLAPTLAGPLEAAVPPWLVEPTVRMSLLVAAGEAGAVAPAPILALTEGVMKAMFLSKLKMAATTLVIGCAMMLTTVAGWQGNSAGAADPPKPGEPSPKVVRDPNKERIAQLERECALLRQEVALLRERLALAEAKSQTLADQEADRQKLQIERAAREIQIQLDLYQAARQAEKAERKAKEATPAKPTPGEQPNPKPRAPGSAREPTPANPGQPPKPGEKPRVLIVQGSGAPGPGSGIPIPGLEQPLLGLFGGPPASKSAQAAQLKELIQALEAARKDLEAAPPKPQEGPAPSGQPKIGLVPKPGAPGTPVPTIPPAKPDAPPAPPANKPQPRPEAGGHGIQIELEFGGLKLGGQAKPQTAPPATKPGVPSAEKPGVPSAEKSGQATREVNEAIRRVERAQHGSGVSEKPVIRVHRIEGVAANEKDAQAIIKVIRATVLPKTWGENAEIEYYAPLNVVIIRQTAEAHKEIEDLLKALEQKLGKAK